MPEYYNPWPHVIELVGPSGERIRVKGYSHNVLNEYYSRYVDRGYLQLVEHKQSSEENKNQNNVNITPRINKITNIKPEIKNRTITDKRDVKQPVVLVPTHKGIKKQPALDRKSTTNYNKQISRSKIVGRQINGDAKAVYNEIKSVAPYRISNGNVICILSYNRANSLLRLINSIKKTVDLEKTTVIISDDCSTDIDTVRLLNQLSQDPLFVVIRNDKNIGISGNTNRLLRCAKRFEHIFLLNDDVEFIKPNWEQFYIQNSKQTGLHHLCYRQSGVYGAKDSEIHRLSINNIKVNVIEDKPHGAFLYISNIALKTCGYFNEQYETYGMEHVDWSMKPFEFSLQPKGFFDFNGSHEYIRIHPEKTSVIEKAKWYNINKKLFASRKEKLYCEPSNNTIVPSISYIIPCRDFERQNSIKTVINGVIGQSFPEIDIILVEQDTIQKLNQGMFPTIQYLYVGDNNPLFNKSKAFNKGAQLVKSTNIVLHDADMLSRVDYTSTIYNLLLKHEAIHICGRVLYLDVNTTNTINKDQKIPVSPDFERMVGYFEGGSLAARKDVYWKIGAFNEDFWGYGCFLPGNKVITDHGLINIEEVKEFHKLLTHSGTYRKQEARIREYTGKVLDIYIPGRMPIKGVTPNHPFLVHDINNEYVWREAQFLKKGDLLAQTDITINLLPNVVFENVLETEKLLEVLQPDGDNNLILPKFNVISDIYEYNYSGLVYNFEVEIDHSYYVHGVNVHNCEDCDFYARLKSVKSWLCSDQYDLIHLWHSRTPNWNNHHAENKKLESQLALLPIEKRIELQLEQLKRLGYKNENPFNA